MIPIRLLAKLISTIIATIRDDYKIIISSIAVLFCADLTKFKENAANDTNDGCSRNKKRKK